MKFRIEGVDRNSGQDRSIEIDADTPESATEAANRMGMLVSGCWSTQSDSKRCPFCGEQVKESAIKCRHCGSALLPVGAIPYARDLVGVGGHALSTLENQSNAGRTCSVLSIIFGGVAWIFCPLVFGLAGIVLGIIGIVMSREKALGIVGLSLSVFRTIGGLVLAALISES